MVAVAAGLLTLGGCRVDTGERETGSEKVAQVLEAGRGEFDLTSPPSRAEAGLPAGRTQITYEQPDKRPFQVRVSLPEGHQLDLAVRLVGFDSLGSPDPSTGPPTTLDIHHHPADLAAGRDHLLAAAAQFGLDPQPIQEWYTQATSSRPAGAPGTVRSRWLSTALGYLQLQVQGRYAPPVDAAGSDQVVVHYALTWSSDPGPGPS